MDACVATVAVVVGWASSFCGLRRDGSMYVCAAREGKVWLSKPGGVAGALALYCMYLWQGWSMLRCTV